MYFLIFFMFKNKNQKNPQIVASNLSVIYFPGQSNEVRSLDNVSLSINEGEFVIFFGPSGCGKSTLLYSIAGLQKVDGSVNVENVDLNKMSSKAKENYYRNTIGMVFQAFHLIPTLSVLQNVTLPLVASGVSFKERQARGMELLTRFGVKNQANKLPSELSGGQQQRVAICRAVVNDPKIILADEPLGNLDSKSANEVVNLFKDLNLRLKKTVILVTHDPTYLDIANRIFFIKDGKLIDTKVNKNVVDANKLAKEVISLDGDKITKSKELDFLDKHYSRLKNSASSSLLSAYYAKNLATLSLFNISAEEFELLRDKIDHSLSVDDDFVSVRNFLDIDQSKGGLGMDRRTANRLAKKLVVLYSELKAAKDFPRINSINRRATKVGKEEEKKEAVLRKYLFDELNIVLKNPLSLPIIDKAILDRSRGLISKNDLFYLLDRPFPEGAAMDRRTVNKLVKRLEILLIEFKGE